MTTRAGAVTISASAVAGASVQDIRAFWDQSLELVAAVAPQVTYRSRGDATPFEVFELEYTSVGGVVLQALLARPKDMTRGPLPGLLTGPGFGGWAQGIELSECQRGYVILQAFPRGQGLSEAALPIATNEKLTAALDRPADHYYRLAYVDLVVALGVLASDPAVDPARLGSVGTSQGGGLALALAALDARIKAVVANLPFLCGMRDCAAIEGSLVYELLDEAGLRSSPNLGTLDYFDPVQLAPWIGAPTLLTSGGRDRACPPGSISAVYDRLPGVRCLLHEPGVDHAPSGSFYSATWWWLDWHLRQSTAA